MRLYIFGANGMLGNYMSSYLSRFYEITKITRKDYDISKLSIATLDNFLLSLKINQYDIIINCAGSIPQRQNNEKKREYYLINSIFPIILSLFCKERNIKFIHITTDCVFSGNDGNYNENSVPDEIKDYGTSKSLGDLSYATIIRTSIIGEELNNKKSLLEWVRSNKNREINGYDDHHWNGVTCLELAKITHGIIENNLFWTGVRHIFSPTSVTKYQLLLIINEIYELNIKISKISSGKCDKTLSSIFEPFEISELYKQIKELKEYSFDRMPTL